ncbi:hypothetical protein PHET_09872 [Paragonimus heterotremus]|uniref:HMG box domain-containing protein n=1 Tax=Paragonimus heterotremus TaxID=100268 RepID=A0A8J4WEI0_9TREM|nr:hypothetical protein PHET_09872 [Paragonimus heterotremus]
MPMSKLWQKELMSTLQWNRPRTCDAQRDNTNPFGHGSIQDTFDNSSEYLPVDDSHNKATSLQPSDKRLTTACHIQSCVNWPHLVQNENAVTDNAFISLDNTCGFKSSSTAWTSPCSVEENQVQNKGAIYERFEFEPSCHHRKECQACSIKYFPPDMSDTHNEHPITSCTYSNTYIHNRLRDVITSTFDSTYLNQVDVKGICKSSEYVATECDIASCSVCTNGTRPDKQEKRDPSFSQLGERPSFIKKKPTVDDDHLKTIELIDCPPGCSSNHTQTTYDKHVHIKKPLNAFMLFMKEKRTQVMAECTLKESAAINQILGRKWHALTREEQAKYYEMARIEKEAHQRMFPGWSARDNYACQMKRRKKRMNRDFLSFEPKLKSDGRAIHLWTHGSYSNVTSTPSTIMGTCSYECLSRQPSPKQRLVTWSVNQQPECMSLKDNFDYTFPIDSTMNFYLQRSKSRATTDFSTQRPDSSNALQVDSDNTNESASYSLPTTQNCSRSCTRSSQFDFMSRMSLSEQSEMQETNRLRLARSTGFSNTNECVTQINTYYEPSSGTCAVENTCEPVYYHPNQQPVEYDRCRRGCTHRLGEPSIRISNPSVPDLLQSTRSIPASYRTSSVSHSDQASPSIAQPCVVQSCLMKSKRSDVVATVAAAAAAAAIALRTTSWITPELATNCLHN